MATNEEVKARRKLYRVLTKKRFAKWLRSHRHEQHVGRAGYPRGCPLAEYLRECGFRRPDIIPGVQIKLPDGSEVEFALPEWADEFSHNLDVHTKCHADPDDPPDVRYIANEDGHVTAGEAIEILEGRW